ncbi:MAG: ATP-binding protein [Bacteriovoracia bacterium]
MEKYWEISGWENEDYHLKKMNQMPFRRQFPFIPKDNGLYVIRGPRQIGKTSWLKTVLSEYAKDHPCFYLSCENITDHRELTEILRSVSHCKLVLLDEVSFVKDWDRSVKYAVDSGWTSILMITGSHAHDLKKGADQMPGRFGGGGEFYLLPMSFDEFYEARLEAGWVGEDRVKELEVYFRVGGFPTAVAEAGLEARTPVKARETYLRWLKGDIVKLGKNEAMMEELLIQLALTQTTPLSFQTLAKKTTIGSHNTVQDYISILESCFALRTLHAIDLDTKAHRLKKDRKFYFTDPLIFWIAHDLSGVTQKEELLYPKLAELVAHTELARSHRRFGYHSNSDGEIDFIMPGEWAVEVKWSDVATNLSKSYLKLVSPNKRVWSKNNFLL